MISPSFDGACYVFTKLLSIIIYSLLCAVQLGSGTSVRIILVLSYGNSILLCYIEDILYHTLVKHTSLLVLIITIIIIALNL